MIAVIDASAAAEIILERPSSTELVDLLNDAEWVIAPSVYTPTLHILSAILFIEPANFKSLGVIP